MYPGSEAALGKILEKNNIREQVYIATKLPHYLIKNIEGMEKLFNEQLKRLRTDYIDYYLMHMLTDTDTWNRLKELGIEEWLDNKRQSGAIRQVGFSYHGNSDMFCKLVDAYDWDFTQIQYNYMDEHSQAGRSKKDIFKLSHTTYSRPMGFPLAVESARGNLRIVRHEFRNNP